ncbi:hypothetical protein BVI2075_860014 [Burkholderia vietnamiensis]|nr:hypothetical protein BVI2075_860014 [Burkholderia vietnamiensis]
MAAFGSVVGRSACRPAHPVIGTRSHQPASSSDGLRPARTPRRPAAADPTQHGFVLSSVELHRHRSAHHPAGLRQPVTARLAPPLA